MAPGAWHRPVGKPWPDADSQATRIAGSIAAGVTWMVRDSAGNAAATVALDTFSDPQLWTPEEQREPALYLHRLMVRRPYAGLGREVLDWACARRVT
jgi:hypothetical protein